jgi:hydroxypyruvate reductase
MRAAASEAADAAAAVGSTLYLDGDVLHLGPHTVALRPEMRLFLIALGKASPAMSRAAAEILGGRLTRGLAAVPHDTSCRMPPRVSAIAAGHPLPDAGSIAAGRAIASLLAGTKREDLVLALISGGGSAMVELPIEGITLADLRSLNRLLLGSGATIDEMNRVRRAVSQLKGGGLARLAAPARVFGLILSDVPGDHLGSVASGPTLLLPNAASQTRTILRGYGLWRRIPRRIREALSRAPTRLAQTPRPVNVLIGSNKAMLEAAAAEARRLGFRTINVSRRMHGEASVVGRRLARRLRREEGPVCLLLGGETTVTLHGRGRGGRNQELALSAAVELDGLAGVALMGFASDGVDGPTDAAGAVVTGRTADLARRLGVDLGRALAGHDSYHALDRLGALVRTGPTGTNVADLVVGLRYRSDSSRRARARG